MHSNLLKTLSRWEGRMSLWFQSFFVGLKLRVGPYWPALFFGLGFLIDILFSQGLDDTFTFAQHSVYLFLAMALTMSEYVEFANSQSFFVRKLLVYRTTVSHFLLGSLLSNYFVLFYKSASITSSFLFLASIAMVLVANEFRRVQSAGRVPRLILSLVCLLCYSLIVVPVLWGSIGVFPFLVSIVFSIVLFLSFVHLFSNKGLGLLAENRKNLLFPSVGVLVFFLFSYTMKWTPPIPMAIKHVGVYHGVKRVQSENGARKYQVEFYKSWWRFWNHSEEYFYSQSSGGIYVFFRVFSPARFNENLVVRWYHYQNDQWVNWDNVNIVVSGGRLEGYRGYVKKSNFKPGEWRIKIETQDQRVMAELDFDVNDKQADEEDLRIELH